MFKKLKQLKLIKVFKLQGKERKMIYLVVVVLFVVFNLLLSGFSFRYDGSFGQAYTLSASSKKILRDLDDIVNIKFFASSGLPSRLLPLKTDVTDFLSEYSKVGRGKIRLKVLDPKKDTKAANEARESSVPELQFSQLEQDKYAVTAAYFGIVLAYEDKTETIPQVTDLENLEYNLTAAIYKLTRKDAVKIGVVGETSSLDQSQDRIATLRKVLSQQFTLEDLNISSSSATTAIDSQFKTVLVFDTGTKQFDEQEIKLLQEYLKTKGRAVFFADGVWVSDNLTTTPADHNLFSLLEDYGVRIEKNLVLSTSSELVSFGGGQVSLFLPYPFWLRTNNFNPKISLFSNINQLTFPWVSSLSLSKKNNLETKELVKTAPRSWEQKDNFILNPQSIPPPENKELKSFTIAADVLKKDEGQIVVIPSSRFVLDQYLSSGSDNLEFVLNLVNNLASSGALAGIRSRAVSFYPLPDLPESQKDVFKYLNILLLPGLFSLWGAIRLVKRR